ncbi:MAG: hypothetical protein IPK19_02410 [Chloroflexi bacterium]|nr:hypothetical protein [Chloroflexota bacterium]
MTAAPESAQAKAKVPLNRGTLWARRLIALLAGVILSLLLLEGLLSLDPVGLRYIRDYKVLTDQIVPAPAGYTYAAGEYRLSRSTVTMLDDGTRLVPDSSESAEQTLVLVGDSVTFGLGVSDDQTFANLIARARQDLRVINAGMPAFNIVNIRRLVEQQAPDAQILYLISDNDADPIFEPSFNPDDRLPDLSWIALYWRFLPVVMQASDPRFSNAGRDVEAYLREATAVTSDPRVLAAGYDDVLTPITPGAMSIPAYTTRLSFADKHPDANGHRQIAEALLRLLE